MKSKTSSLSSFFPLLELPSPILTRFISLLPSDDAEELSKSCKTLNWLVRIYGYKTVENLVIHGKELASDVTGFSANLSSSYNNLKLSVTDPTFEKKVKNTIVKGKLTLINVDKGLLTKLTTTKKFGVALEINSICVLNSELSLEDFQIILRLKRKLKVVEFQRVSIFPLISFSDALKLTQSSYHVHLDISNMKFHPVDPISDLLQWQRSATTPFHHLTLRFPSHGFSMDKFMEFHKQLRTIPLTTQLIFNEFINVSWNFQTELYFLRINRKPRILRSHGASIIMF